MLRALIGFDQCPRNVQNSWIANSGLPIGAGGYYGGANKPLIVNDAGVFTTIPGVASGGCMWPLNLTPYAKAGARKLVIGMRLFRYVQGGADTLGYIGTTGGAADLLPSFSQLSLSAAPAGSNWWMEILLDTLTATGYIYLDGVQVRSFSIPTMNATLAGGTVLLWLMAAPQNVEGCLGYRDIYFLDELQGDGITARLGPRIVVPVSIDAASATDWTTTDSSPLLTTINAATSIVSPALAVSGPSKTPLNLSLKANIPAGGQVEGLMMLGSLKADSASLFVGSSISGGGSSTPVKTFQPGTTLKYGNMVSLFPRAPDGSRWTNANIDATSVLVTPDLLS